MRTSRRFNVATSALSLAQLVRLPAMFTVISNVVAAHWIAAGGDIELPRLLLTLLASLCLYHGGMVLNDCFDQNLDRAERPHRPIPAGRVSAALAWGLGWGLALSGVLLAFVLGFNTGLIGCALLLAIVCYNAGARSGWPAAVLMGSCRYLNWLLALSVFGLSWPLLLLPLPVLCYVTALTRISQQEVEAAERTVLLAAAMLIALGVILLVTLFTLPLLVNGMGLVAAGVGLLLLARQFWRLAGSFQPAHIQALVASLVFGIIPLDAVLLLSAGYHWVALGVLLLLLPGKWLGRKLVIS